MAELALEGQRIVEDAARRYGISTDAVRVLLEALVASGGGMAQFNHPELGGMGQWSSGGMIMIGDMFNNGLKNTVAMLCGELSNIVGRGDVIADRPQSSQWQSQGGAHKMPMPESSLFISDPGGLGSGDWWPADLGMPASTGAQNAMRYACFPDRRRLALDVNGQISVYDTGDHWITGFSQQQGGDQSLSFTSQYGVVRLDSLTLVHGAGQGAGFAQSAPVAASEPVWQAAPETGQAGGDVFTSIERLAGLRDKGIISEAEFAAKKTELLGRL
jgi:hypothetical protein